MNGKDFGRLFFDVRHLEWDVYDDLSKPPTNGEQYLRRVMNEAASCQEVVVADLSKLNLPNKQNVVINAGTGLYECPAAFLPSRNVQETHVEQFSIVRQEIVQGRASGKFHMPLLPQYNTMEAWHTFCFGLSHGQTLGVGPLLKIVLPLCDARIDKLLAYHVRWLKPLTVMSQVAGQWCYGLLAAVSIPLKPDTVSTIRDLARECSRMRSLTISECDPMIHTYNLLISLIARFFGQLDLADGYKE